MIRCSLSYHKSKVDELPIFAVGIRNGIYNNDTVFPTPPTTPAALELLIQDYIGKRGTYENGGSAQKGPYQQAKQALMDGLDSLANYVNSVANGNESIILLSGFVPTKGYRSDKLPPVQPSGVALKRPATGAITAECANQKVATNYVCFVTIDNPMPNNVILNDNGQLVYMSDNGASYSIGSGQAVPNVNENPGAETMNVAVAFIDFNPGRKKEFRNLQLGRRYYFYFVAANAHGVSTFSDAVSIICG